MKTYLFICIFFYFFFGKTFAQQTTSKIGSESFIINSSAALEVQSNSKGFLPPRMTTLERNNIINPAEGLVIYNLTSNQLETNIGTTTVPVWSGNAPDASTTQKGLIQLAGDLSGVATSQIVTNEAVLGKVLNGFTSGTVKSTVSSSDNILQAFQKIDGNVALKAPINSPALTGIPTAPSAVAGTSTTQIATTEFVNKTTNLYIPTSQYPTFSPSDYQILSGALWVGYDATLGVWKYLKQISGNGLNDPGNPSGWEVNGGAIGVFNGDMSILPSGTHINFKYDPRTKAAMYNQDDIAVRIANLWVDKYEARIVDVTSNSFIDNDNSSLSNTVDTDINGSGQKLPNSYLSFSQKKNGSSGMSWYVAQVALANNEKRLLTNSEWQVAAAGTEKSDSSGPSFGDNWVSVGQTNISRYGIVGCAGSLWEWVADTGQYGPSTGNLNNTVQNQYGVDVQYNINGVAYTNNNVESVNTPGLPPGYSGYIYSRAALIRGGSYSEASGSGIFAVAALFAPSAWAADIGFRGVRQ